MPAPGEMAANPQVTVAGDSHLGALTPLEEMIVSDAN